MHRRTLLGAILAGSRLSSPQARASVPIVVTALVFFLPSVSEAASFSCSAPIAPRERLICADPELSRADEALAAAYKAALGALSEPGRETIREGQRQWLRYTQTVCRIGAKAPTDRPSDDCLKDEYAARQRQLDNAVVKRGGLVIRRVDVFKAAPSHGPGSGGRYPRFNTMVVSYPQIDQPRDFARKLGTSSSPSTAVPARRSEALPPIPPTTTTSLSTMCSAAYRRR